ncbi:DEAD/DEAH box helicase [Georgenia ruanii]|uniref:DEAD/DEAH box helicase n=1 Tax=Georgenia ruanii TaxID=348442 RepID=A0A7J9UUU7_9MICO|nr:DEAD/DEAH box helicase [Georgenia ruanii]
MPTDGASFAALGVPAPLVRSLSSRGITAPFPIQSATLPDTLAGRDVLGRGRTGSGKTLAFALPLVARLAALVPSGEPIPGRSAPSHPRGLVLAPTRELATQIAETVTPLAEAAGLRVTTIFGGVKQGRQVEALQRGVDIVVACPGRLEDLMHQKLVHLDAVAVTVLDEADHMADLGFLPGVTRILKATPAGIQRLLFSATLDNGVDKLVRQFLRNPLHHSVDSAASPVAAMVHHVFEVAGTEEKNELVRTLASGTSRRMLFTRTKHQAKKLARQLTASGIPAVELHGNLSQNARERSLDAFASGEVRVMVATDIAARGIHVDDVELVVHVDPPAEHKAYLHRSGRTARAGHGGDVVTVVLPEQRGDFRQLARAAKIHATPARVTATDPRVLTLVGDVAPTVAPDRAPVAASRKPAPQQPKAARSAAAGRQRGGAAGGHRTGDVAAAAPAARSSRSRRGRGAGATARSGSAGGGSRPVYSSTTGEAPAGSGLRGGAEPASRPRGRRRATASGRHA